MDFHTSRTIPLSDICKTLVGRNHGKTVILESLTLAQTYSDSPLDLEFELEYEGTIVERGTLDLSNKPISLPLNPIARLTGPGLTQWSMFTLIAVTPRPVNKSPITTELEILLRFATESDNDIIQAAKYSI